MTEQEFSKLLAKIEHQFGEDGETFTEIVEGMMNMLDQTDADDYFGSEGWRRDFGWE